MTLLLPIPAALWKLPRRQREAVVLRYYLAPLTAAAVVVALAVTLVLVRDIPNGGVVPPASSPSTGLGGVPRYYVALAPADGNPRSPNVQNVVVAGDALTGEKLATIPPPAGILKLLNVTGAADDRTFVVAALARSGSAASAEWFSVRLAPGTAHPVSMTPLPVKSQPVPSNPTWLPDVGLDTAFPTALSGSGQELAVAEITNSGGLAVKVFSLATGQLRHEWTTNDQSLSRPRNNGLHLLAAPALTWIDGDRALAVTTLSNVTQSVPVTRKHDGHAAPGAADAGRRRQRPGPAGAAPGGGRGSPCRATRPRCASTRRRPGAAAGSSRAPSPGEPRRRRPSASCTTSRGN